MASEKHWRDQLENVRFREKAMRQGRRAARWESKSVLPAFETDVERETSLGLFWNTFLLKVVFSPIWFFFYLWERRLRRQNMERVVEAFEREGRGDDFWEMALTWVELFQDEYPHKEHDDKFLDVETDFWQIIQRRIVKNDEVGTSSSE